MTAPHGKSSRDQIVDMSHAPETIAAGNRVVYFSIDPVWKIQLLNGWDDIDLTLAEKVHIDRFRAADAKARPWTTPRP